MAAEEAPEQPTVEIIAPATGGADDEGDLLATIKIGDGVLGARAR